MFAWYIFRTQSIIENSDIFRHIQVQNLLYSELCHIQNFGIEKLAAYSESCLLRHIYAYSNIFNNDNINFVSSFFFFFFFFFFFSYFSTGYKNAYINDVNFNAQPSLFKWYAIFEKSV